MTLGVTHHGANEHALVALGLVPNVNLFWLVDGAKVQDAPVANLSDGSFPLKEVQTIDLVSTGKANPTALIGWNTGLYRGDMIRGPGHAEISLQQVPLPRGPGHGHGPRREHRGGVPVWRWLRHGDGCSIRWRGLSVSAVPTKQPQEIGTQWVASAPVPGLSTMLSPRYLECRTRSCASSRRPPRTRATSSSTPTMPGPRLWWGWGSPPIRSLPERTSTHRRHRASDADGDASGWSVTEQPVAAENLTLAPRRQWSGGVDLSARHGDRLREHHRPLTIAATDGLDEHMVVRNYQLQVLHTLQPSPPGSPRPMGRAFRRARASTFTASPR